MEKTSITRDTLADLWIPSIYAQKVRSQRTRAYSLDIAEKENEADILYTLLGFELKVGNKRFASPDLATARYLRLFARLGCREFAVPYDITMISTIADELETAWQHFVLTINAETKKVSPQSAGRTRAALIRGMRNEIISIGAGSAMPAFKQSTRQRAND